ncbi:hypothetical protein PV326_005084 [Microctonus aethiopoides]|nr:hypothetical protein PV326_005084 [Microctonus aethiopoides]
MDKIQTTRQTTSRSTSPSVTQVQSNDPLQQTSAMETALNTFIAQQTLFNHKLMDMMSEHNDKLVAQQTLFNDKFVDFNSKLTEINNLAKTVANQQVKINKLELQNSTLAKNITTLVRQQEINTNDVKVIKHDLTKALNHSSPEMIISGVPIQLAIEPQTVVNNLLRSLNAPHLENDILDIRKISSKNNMSTSTQNDKSSKSSYIVRFKSEHVARHVITLKRRKGILTLKEVFSSNVIGNIYVNEFLPPQVHALYRKTKELAKLHKFKYVWVKDGNISVRHSDNTPIINILTDEDLHLITPSD